MLFGNAYFLIASVSDNFKSDLCSCAKEEIRMEEKRSKSVIGDQ